MLVDGQGGGFASGSRPMWLKAHIDLVFCLAVVHRFGVASATVYPPSYLPTCLLPLVATPIPNCCFHTLSIRLGYRGRHSPKRMFTHLCPIFLLQC